MNRDKQELYNQVISDLESLDLESLTRLKEILIANPEQYKTNPVEAIKNALTTIMNDEQLTTPEDQGYARTIHSNQERGKSFVESMSSQARVYREGLATQREQRYEEMISEAEEKLGPIESPMDRLRR
ncbi:MAG: hypothetical protein ACI4XM_03505 [Candidatus Coprovivens sp.]